MNNLSKTVLLMFFLIFFECTIPTDFYIQNHTNEIKTIKIKYKSNFSNKLKEPIYFEQIDELIKPKNFKKSKEKNNIKVKVINFDESLLGFELQPTSTIRIVKSKNFIWLNKLIDYVFIDEEKIEMLEIKISSEKIKNDYVYKIR